MTTWMLDREAMVCFYVCSFGFRLLMEMCCRLNWMLMIDLISLLRFDHSI